MVLPQLILAPLNVITAKYLPILHNMTVIEFNLKIHPEVDTGAVSDESDF